MNNDQPVSFPDFLIKPVSMYFVSCPKQGLEMEAVVLHRVGIFEKCCPKQGQDFKPSAAPLYPNIGQVPPPPPPEVHTYMWTLKDKNSEKQNLLCFAVAIISYLLSQSNKVGLAINVINISHSHAKKAAIKPKQMY